MVLLLLKMEMRWLILCFRMEPALKANKMAVTQPREHGKSINK